MAKKKSSAACSSAGKALAECRWGKGKKKKKPAGTKKPRKKAKKVKPKRGAAGKKVENILVPGLNPPRGDMASFIEQQRRLYGD